MKTLITVFLLAFTLSFANAYEDAHTAHPSGVPAHEEQSIFPQLHLTTNEEIGIGIVVLLIGFIAEWEHEREKKKKKKRR